MQSSMFVMIGKGYCLRMIALLCKCKSVICLTWPSFLGIMNAGTPIQRLRKVEGYWAWPCDQVPFKSSGGVCEVQDKRGDAPVLLQVWGQFGIFCKDRLQWSHQIFFVFGKDVEKIMALIKQKVMLVESNIMDVSLLIFSFKNTVAKVSTTWSSMKSCSDSSSSGGSIEV